MHKTLTAQGPRNRKSYTVTLPLDWVKQQRLDKSRAVNLEVVGNKIVISTSIESSGQVIVDLRKYSHTLLKVLQGLYRKGVNEIKLMNYTSEQLPIIIDIINSRLIGYEIIEQKKDYLLVKDITKESSEEFEHVVRRIFLLLLELMNAEESEQERINALEKNIKRLVNYGKRVLIKSGHSDYLHIPFYYVLLDLLEKIADESSWVLSIKSLSKSQKSSLKQIMDCARKAYELYYKFDGEEFDRYEFKTYQILKQIRGSGKIEVFDMHIHNLARILNTIYANIFVLKGKE